MATLTFRQFEGNAALQAELLIKGVAAKASNMPYKEFYKQTKNNIISDIDKHMDFFIGYALASGYTMSDFGRSLLTPVSAKNLVKLSMVFARANVSPQDAMSILGTNTGYSAGIKPMPMLLNMYSNPKSVKKFAKVTGEMCINAGIGVLKFKIEAGKLVADVLCKTLSELGIPGAEEIKKIGEELGSALEEGASKAGDAFESGWDSFCSIF